MALLERTARWGNEASILFVYDDVKMLLVKTTSINNTKSSRIRLEFFKPKQRLVETEKEQTTIDDMSSNDQMAFTIEKVDCGIKIKLF